MTSEDTETLTTSCVNTAKAKLQGSRLLLNNVLRSKGVKWRRAGAAKDRLEWVARNLGATFVDPNSWIRDADFGRGGLHLNRNGARQLGNLFFRVCEIDGQSQKLINDWLHTVGSEFSKEISEGSRKKATQENPTLDLEAVEVEKCRKRDGG